MNSILKWSAITIVLCTGFGVLSACSMTSDEAKERIRKGLEEHHDPDAKLDREDYEHPYRPKAGTPKDISASTGLPNEPPIPEVADILAAPRPPKIGESKLVSISVTEDVPLKDVLIELSRLADVDMEIDPNISGGIIFSAREKPFNDVIQRIADLAGLRYTMKAGVLRVEKDEPFIKNYSLDFLNIERNSQSNVTISTNVLSSSGGGGGSSGSSSGGGSASGGLNSGSTSSVTATADSDLWKQLLEGVNQILAHQSNTYIVDNTNKTEGATATPSNAGGGVPGQAAAGAAGATAGNGKTFFVVNKQAGVITISATERQHDLIDRFIKKLKMNASAQVLIDAKIVEVTLDKEFQAGVDWQTLQDAHGIDVNFPATSLNPVNGLDVKPFTLTVGSGVFRDLTGAVKLLDDFGTTRTLSSPRLHAINNQQAVLTVAENKVFFEIKVEKEQQAATTTGTVGTTTYNLNSTVKTVPIGIILTLQPSIDLEHNEVTLNVRPTLSRLSGEVDDPAVAFLASQGTGLENIKNKIPVVEVRELDSVLKLASGQVMVIGGLMQQRNANTEEGVPYADQIPVLGNLFKRRDSAQQTKELIIFIRATIVNSLGSADQADQTIYKKFIDDPRPLTF